MLRSLKSCWSERYFTNEHRQHKLQGQIRVRPQLLLTLHIQSLLKPCLPLPLALKLPIFFPIFWHQPQSFLKHISPLALKPPCRGRQSHSPSQTGQLRSMEDQLFVHNQQGDQQSWVKMGFINTEPLSIQTCEIQPSQRPLGIYHLYPKWEVFHPETLSSEKAIWSECNLRLAYLKVT